MIGLFVLSLQLPAQIDPVDVGQSEIDDHDVGLGRFDLFEGLGTRRRGDDLVVTSGQAGLHHP